MDKITKLEDFRQYINYLKWFEDYQAKGVEPEREKPKLPDNIKLIVSKSNRLKNTDINSDVFYGVMIDKLNSMIPNYIIDDNNKKAIMEIAKFTTKEGVYQNRVNKGFLLMGGTGTGKSKISEAFIDIIRRFFNMKIRFNPSYEYVEDFTKHQYDGLLFTLTSMRFIDDLGSENLYNNYGVTTNVVLEYLYRVYDKKITMFGTTNLDPASLKKFYGERGYSRMVEMLHFITLNGNDKRK